MRTPSSALPSAPQGLVEGGGNSCNPPFPGLAPFIGADIVADIFTAALMGGFRTNLPAAFLGFTAVFLTAALVAILRIAIVCLPERLMPNAAPPSTARRLASSANGLVFISRQALVGITPHVDHCELADPNDGPCLLHFLASGHCVPRHFLRSALCGLRLPMRPLSLPAAGSITALMRVGLPESMASFTARLSSSGVVTWAPTPPKASIILS